MAMMTDKRDVTTYADLDRVIRYAMGVMPAAYPPDAVAGVGVQFNVHVHRVPLDLLAEAVANNLDLLWEDVRYFSEDDEERWTISVKFQWSTLTIYSRRYPLGERNEPMFYEARKAASDE